MSLTLKMEDIREDINYEALKEMSDWDGIELFFVRTPVRNKLELSISSEGCNKESEELSRLYLDFFSMIAGIHGYVKSVSGERFEKNGQSLSLGAFYAISRDHNLSQGESVYSTFRNGRPQLRIDST